MIIFRPHRGSLADSLEEAREFDTVGEMKKYIVDDWKKHFDLIGLKSEPFGLDDIVIDEESVDDDRCGWHDCRYVCIKRLGKEIYDIPQCVGMCATDYEKGILNV